MKEHSDFFMKLFDSRTNGCLRQCVCGRTHFDVSDNGWTWEDGELEKLEQLAKENPDRYIPVYGAVGTMNIMGNEIVYDCHCNSSLKFEEFIVQHAEEIAQYLNARAKNLEEKASKIKVEAQ